MDFSTKKRKRNTKKLLAGKKFLAFLSIAGVFGVLLVLPSNAYAFSISSFIKNFFHLSNEAVGVEYVAAKPFPFLSPVGTHNPEGANSVDSGLEFVDETAITSSVGPLGNTAEAIDSISSYKISTYTVRHGDTLPLIAKTFGVSVSTIRWANDIPKSGLIREGQTLVILPVSGVKHTVAKGDTIKSIAKKYGGDESDIIAFNDIPADGSLELGQEVIIPDGELSQSAPVPKPGSKPVIVRGGGPDLSGYYLAPLTSYKKTQGIHGYNGVDLANSIGTPVRAAASGVVIIAKGSGWNGGYGKYVVISHANGTQTLYGHLNSVSVGPGESVSQGQNIGTLGNSGRSTGPHLHFEVRGAKNPF